MTSNAPDTTNPAGIIRLSNAFCDSKALMTAVELGLFNILREAPATEEDLRERLGLHGRGLRDWLELLVELKLLKRDGDRYRNGDGADRYLVRGDESYIGGFVERSNRNLYPAWGRLPEALRTGESQSGSHFDKVIENPAILAQFVNSMDALTNVLGAQLIDAYDGWTEYASVLDVGGCRGNMVSQVLKAHPHLSGAVFDLPQMSPLFDALAAENGLTDRISFHGGSFFVDPLPSADIVMIGHVLHDWDAEQRKFLVEKAFGSVNPGGVLLVYDRMLDRPSSRVENLVISLDMLLVTDGGSEYYVDEIRGYAESIGAESFAVSDLGDYDTLIVVRKAG